MTKKIIIFRLILNCISIFLYLSSCSNTALSSPLSSSYKNHSEGILIKDSSHFFKDVYNKYTHIINEKYKKSACEIFDTLYFDNQYLINDIDSCQAIYNVGLALKNESYTIEAIKLLILLEQHMKSNYDFEEKLGIELARTKLLLGRLYAEYGLWTMGMKFFKESLEIFQLFNYKPGIADTLHYIGSLFLLEKDYETAKDYLHKAIEINNKLNRPDMLFASLNSIGVIYSLQDNSIAARDFYIYAKDQLNKQNNEYYNVILNINLSENYLKLNNSNRALELLNGIDLSLCSKTDLIYYYALKADYFIANKQYENAEKQLTAAIKLSEDLKNLKLKMWIHKKLFDYYIRLGNIDRAKANIDRYVDLRDTLEMRNRKSNDMLLSAISSSKDIVEPNMVRINELKSTAESYHRMVLYISIFVLFILIIGSVLYFRMSSVIKRIMRSYHHIKKSYNSNFEERIKLLNTLKNEQEEVELINKKSTRKSLQLIETASLLAKISNFLNMFLENSNEEGTKSSIAYLINEIKQVNSLNRWDEFKTSFENIHVNFYKNILNDFPLLTKRELRLCAFLKLGLSNKEISSITFVELRSVDSARNRLRKKLGLSPEDSLTNFLIKY